jgi:predicted AlkP superfamily pyrophosphatase or phosphodiesterase
MNKINRIIYIIIDSVSSECFFALINKGLLPNIKKIMDNGVFSKNCITDFPSITYPTQVSMITGTYTGDFRKELCHGVPLSHWMDRSYSPPILRSYDANDLQIYKINDDLGLNCKTLFEMVGDGNKTSIIQFINRGVDYFYPENKLKLIYYYLILKNRRNLEIKIAKINTVSIYKLFDNFKNSKKYFNEKEPPILSLLYLFTPDLLMHHFGFDSSIYKSNLLHIDKVLGLLFEKIHKMGYMEETAIAITSDHGNYKAKKVGNLNSFLYRNNLSNYNFRKNQKGNIYIADFGGVGFLYFKGSKNYRNNYAWNFPIVKDFESYGSKQINLLKNLFNIEGTHLMYYKSEVNRVNKGVVYLKRKDRNTKKIYSGMIEYEGTGIDFKTKYIPENFDYDIFGFNKNERSLKLIDNKFHSIQEWLEGTFHLDYALYPDLISRHFKNPRSADIILSTGGEVVYNYNRGKQRSKKLYAHDIGLRNSIVVPLIIGGSYEIPQIEIPYCKTTDIVPTLLKIIGKTPHKSVIGKNLI